MKFGAFIMTYERHHVLEDTISKIFQQSFPPEKILIVDNSESNLTEALIKRLSNPRLEYIRVGENIGPSGASKIGLQRLTAEGFEWIYWGDDDDPPLFIDTFEKLVSLISNFKKGTIGILGAVGHYFNPLSGEIRRASDNELEATEFIQVDSIAGNQSMLMP